MIWLTVVFICAFGDFADARPKGLFFGSLRGTGGVVDCS